VVVVKEIRAAYQGLNLTALIGFTSKNFQTDGESRIDFPENELLLRFIAEFVVSCNFPSW